MGSLDFSYQCVFKNMCRPCSLCALLHYTVLFVCHSLAHIDLLAGCCCGQLQITVLLMREQYPWTHLQCHHSGHSLTLTTIAATAGCMWPLCWKAPGTVPAVHSEWHPLHFVPEMRFPKGVWSLLRRSVTPVPFLPKPQSSSLSSCVGHCPAVSCQLT